MHVIVSNWYFTKEVKALNINLTNGVKVTRPRRHVVEGYRDQDCKSWLEGCSAASTLTSWVLQSGGLVDANRSAMTDGSLMLCNDGKSSKLKHVESQSWYFYSLIYPKPTLMSLLPHPPWLLSSTSLWAPCRHPPTRCHPRHHRQRSSPSGRSAWTLGTPSPPPPHCRQTGTRTD